MNVLTALYQPFGFALIMAVLFMFFYMFIQEYSFKVVIQRWFHEFKTNKIFRRIFYLAFYTTMILFRTLLNRNMWANHLSNVIGIWGIHNEKGELTTEVIENLALFIPFAILLLWCFRDKLIKKPVGLLVCVWQSVKVVFFFSLSIEFLQLFLRLGTFQLSDLFFNTLGGLMGGIIYFVSVKIGLE